MSQNKDSDTCLGCGCLATLVLLLLAGLGSCVNGGDEESPDANPAPPAATATATQVPQIRPASVVGVPTDEAYNALTANGIDVTTWLATDPDVPVSETTYAYTRVCFYRQHGAKAKLYVLADPFACPSAIGKDDGDKPQPKPTPHRTRHEQPAPPPEPDPYTPPPPAPDSYTPPPHRDEVPGRKGGCPPGGCYNPCPPGGCTR